MNPNTPLAAEKHELAVHLRAGVGLVVIETRDEPRALTLLNYVALESMRPLFVWSAARGVRRTDVEHGLNGNFTEPLEVLRHIDQRNDQAIFVLTDFQPYLDDPVAARLLREIARAAQDRGPMVFLVGGRIDLPESLRSVAIRFDLSLPDRDELRNIVRTELHAWERASGGPAVALDEPLFERLVDNLNGLIEKDARRLARNAIREDRVFDESGLPEVMKAKFDLLDPGGVVNFELETERFANVAGMPNLRRWLEQRAPVFASDQPPPGLDVPKGLLLLGVQGCGKSMTARAVAGLFGAPLLHLDCGALYNRFHGESERNMRESLKLAERMSPCVLWIDELEKSMSTGANDGGTSRRMLATLLTWMAERKQRVFLVATANNIADLPPELVRKGRFDEIFFVDLPDVETRLEILAIHLNRRAQKAQLYDLATLARHSEGFSGAELEHAIVSGLYTAHAEGQPLTNGHILDAIRATRPLSVVMGEQIAAMREWARTRTVKA